MAKKSPNRTSGGKGRPPQNGDKPQWLIMVYMVANTDAELDVAAQRDIREMERGVNENVHVVVQVKRTWPDVPQRFLIVPTPEVKGTFGNNRPEGVDRGGTSTLVGAVGGPTNMGTKRALTEFVTWARKTHQAEHYCLVLWGHAYGLGFGRDHGDPLDISEIAEALNAVGAPSGKKPLDLLGANACAMSYLEAAYELRECADFLVASQIGVPFAGWPYEPILKGLRKPMDPRALGEAIVHAYVSHTHAFVARERASMSLLDLRAAEGLKEAVSALALRVEERISEAPAKGAAETHDRLGEVRDILMGIAAGDVRPLIDAADLCKELAQVEGMQAVATKLKTLVLGREGDRSGGLIVKHKAHPELTGLHGVGIFAPAVTHEEDLSRLELDEGALPEPPSDRRASPKAQEPRRGRESYKALSIFKSCPEWPTLVYATLRAPMPDELLKCFDGAGSQSRADRADIAQMALSIDSAFNRLDRAIDRQRKPARDGVKSLRPVKSATKGANQPAQSRPEMLMRAGLRLRLFDLSHLKTKEDSSVQPRANAQVPADGMAFPELKTLIAAFERIEEAIERVEVATTRGLTHATFGLGPLEPTAISTTPTREAFAKPGGHEGAPRHLNGKEAGHQGPAASAPQAPESIRNDLRLDLALAKVVQLFAQVGDSFRALEQAGTEAQAVIRTMLLESPAGVSETVATDFAATEMDRAFQLLQESATSARRTVRSVLSHPIYGIGPGAPGIGLDERQEMAKAGGLSKARLRLLSPLPA